MPPEVIAEFVRAYGALSAIIFVLAVAYYRKDQQLTACQNLRLTDQKERAADALRAAEIIEKQTQAAQLREKAADERWRVTEVMLEIGRTTAERVKSLGEEVPRIGRRVDQLASRLNAGGIAE